VKYKRDVQSSRNQLDVEKYPKEYIAKENIDFKFTEGSKEVFILLNHHNFYFELCCELMFQEKFITTRTIYNEITIDISHAFSHVKGTVRALK